MKTLIPYDDRVIMKKVEDSEMSAKGIFIPKIDKEGATTLGEVIAVGPGRFNVHGDRIPMETKIGDKVLYANFGAHIVELDGEEYLVAKEMDLVSKIEDDETEEKKNLFGKC